jgi:hypothetical protein
MAKGAIIKYNMPWFKPLAGFSPIWDAVFVQTEHCAFTGVEKNTIKKATNNMTEFFFICTVKVLNNSVSKVIV